MIKRFFAYIILLSAFMSAFADNAEIEKAYLDKVGEADVAIGLGRWSEAEELLLRAMDICPGSETNVLLMSNLGIVRYNMGRDSLALATLDDAFSLAPRSPVVLENRARVLQGMGRIDDAFADYSRALDIDSTLKTPRFFHGIISLSRGDTVTARADFERLYKLAPESFDANFGMGMLLFDTGHPLEAIPYYNRVIELDPQAEYYGARALCNLQCERLSEAADDIAKGLELDPNDGELYLYRAILNKMRFRPDDSRNDVRRAVELGVPRERVRLFI